MGYVIALITVVALIAMAALQGIYVAYFYVSLWRTHSLAERSQPDVDPDVQPPDRQTLPRVAVLLCVRGADPSLSECLEGLQNQDLDAFDLFVAVDAPDDPALQLIDECFDDSASPTVLLVDEKRSTSSLKCSALVEALARIPDDYAVIALIDADTVPDQHWLTDLVLPLLSDTGIGATTGTRWFTPGRSGLGTQVRHVWNTAAIVQMHLYNIAWGGSLAIRRDVIERCGLLEKWSHAFCEDTMLDAVLKEHGLRLYRVPHLILENTESTSLASAFEWITRQLLTVRLYHPLWPLVLAHGKATSLGLFFAPLILLILFLFGERRGLVLLGSTIAAYQAWNLLLLYAIDSITLKTLRSRKGFNAEATSSFGQPMYLLATLVCQYIHPLTCSAAQRARQVNWRGIDYRIKDGRIEMNEYLPYSQKDQPDDAGSHSESIHSTSESIH